MEAKVIISAQELEELGLSGELAGKSVIIVKSIPRKKETLLLCKTVEDGTEIYLGSECVSVIEETNYDNRRNSK